jgi:hypothetical protein
MMQSALSEEIIVTELFVGAPPFVELFKLMHRMYFVKSIAVCSDSHDCFLICNLIAGKPERLLQSC